MLIAILFPCVLCTFELLEEKNLEILISIVV